MGTFSVEPILPILFIHLPYQGQATYKNPYDHNSFSVYIILNNLSWYPIVLPPPLQPGPKLFKRFKLLQRAKSSSLLKACGFQNKPAVLHFIIYIVPINNIPAEPHVFRPFDTEPCIKLTFSKPVSLSLIQG